MDVADQADHGYPRIDFWIHAQLFANGILARPIGSRESLIDDSDGRRTIAIRGKKKSPLYKRDAHHFEIVRRDYLIAGVGLRIQRRLRIVRCNKAPAVVAEEWRPRDEACCFHAWQRREFFEKPIIEGETSGLILVMEIRKRKFKGKNIARVEAGVDAAQCDEGADQESGTNEEEHSETALGSDKNAAQAMRLA